jgi:hypothetical protein
MKDTFSVPFRRVGNRRCATGFVRDDRDACVEHGDIGIDEVVGSGSFYTTVSDLFASMTASSRRMATARVRQDISLIDIALAGNLAGIGRRRLPQQHDSLVTPTNRRDFIGDEMSGSAQVPRTWPLRTLRSPTRSTVDDGAFASAVPTLMSFWLRAHLHGDHCSRIRTAPLGVHGYDFFPSSPNCLR